MSSDQSRQSTHAIQQDLAQSGLGAGFVRSECIICFQSVNSDSIVILDQCNHTLCQTCVCTLIDSTQNCPLCRTTFSSVSTKDNGSEDIYVFQQRVNPPLLQPISFGRMLTCGGFGGGGGGGSARAYASNTSYSPSAPAVLPSHPVISGISLVQNSEMHVIHANPDNGLSVVTLLASSDDTFDATDDIFVYLDVSGSMVGARIRCALDALIKIITNLKQGQRITVITFNHGPVHLFPLQHVNGMNRDQLISTVNGLRAEGGTNYMPCITHAKLCLDESGHPDRSKKILFFSDGQPGDNLSQVEISALYNAYPTLIFYAISMGNGVNASEKMSPLLGGRTPDLGSYHDCPNMADFAPLLETLVGNSTTVFATSITVTFKGAIPLTSLSSSTEPGTYTVPIAVLNFNEASNIAFRVTGDEPLSISFSFEKEGAVHTGFSAVDSANVLPASIMFFPRSRVTKEEINRIITDQATLGTHKQQLLRDLLSQISIESHGNYFHELSQTINSIIDSLNPIYQSDNQVQNRRYAAEQHSQRGSSDQFTSRELSSNIRSASQASQASQPIQAVSAVSAVSVAISPHISSILEVPEEMDEA